MILQAKFLVNAVASVHLGDQTHTAFQDLCWQCGYLPCTRGQHHPLKERIRAVLQFVTQSLSKSDWSLTYSVLWGLSAIHTDSGTAYLNVLLLFEGLLTPELSDPITLYHIKAAITFISSDFLWYGTSLQGTLASISPMDLVFQRYLWKRILLHILWRATAPFPNSCIHHSGWSVKNNPHWLVLIASLEEYNLRAIRGYLCQNYMALWLSDCLKLFKMVFINPEGNHCLYC